MRDLPTTTDALLRELVAAHQANARARDLGIPAAQLAMHTGTPDPECDVALAVLERDGLAVILPRTGGYVPTPAAFTVVEASAYNVAVGRQECAA